MTNATWKKHPGSADYDAGSNWSGGVVPNGTAFFGKSSTASLTFSVATAIGGWTFKETASNYSFDIPLFGLPLPAVTLTFVGAGIVVNGGSVSITNHDTLTFLNASTAGSAHITNNANVSFYDSSTAGSAKFTNDNVVQFFDSSKAGSAHFTNNVGGSVEFIGNSSSAGKSVISNHYILRFSNSSTAGAASITNDSGDVDFYLSSNAGAARIANAGDIRFHDTSSAANATFTNVVGASGLVQFFDTSGAGNARISMDIVDFLDTAFASHAHITARHLTFFDSTNAGAAVITTVNGALTEFRDFSDGLNARLITRAGGVVDISQSLHLIQTGSIEGAGTYKLGGNDLYVGFNNRSTNVSGAIDGTAAASLFKYGTGTLKLSHAFNTYAGGTYFHQGTLDVAAQGAAGPGTIFFQLGRQTLKIENPALNNHAFSNTVEFFGAGDAIDLTGLKFVKHAKATYNQGTEILTVHSGKVTDTLELADPSVLQFKVVDDGHGGCKIIAKPPGAKADSLAAAQHDSSQLRESAHGASGDSFHFRAFADRADSFHFTAFAGWLEASQHAGRYEAFGWSEPPQTAPDHHAHVLSAHDFIL